jgi:NAD(P)H-dependent FMN reductase
MTTSTTTSTPKTIIGIAGSTRTGSFNASLLRAAESLAPASLRIEIASIKDVPLYDADVEAKDGLPPRVTELKDRIAAADGLLIVTPEYNHSIPGVLKNAIDWLSRPPKDIGRVFGGKPLAVMGASPGAGGTRLAQAALLPVVRSLELNPWFGRQLYVAKAAQVFDADGTLVDDKIKKLLGEFMAGFADFAAGVRRSG